MFCRRQLITICKKFTQLAPQNRTLTLTAPSLLNQKYRKERGLPLNPNNRGVLTDSADFTFLDGRMTPLGAGQRKRVLRNQEAKNQIFALTKEIDFAIERYKMLQIEEQRKKDEILSRKLKPKGAALLKSS